VFEGATAAAVTTPVAAEEAEEEPALFEPVTTTRIVEPTSAATKAYVLPVAPISAQLAPPESQRCH
jgi:hypothetical protein